MEEITYNIDLSALNDFMRSLSNPDLLKTNTAEAVGEATNYLSDKWIGTASSKLKHTTGWYAQGIQDGTMYPYSSNPLQGAVIHTDKRASYLEKGFEPYDQKRMLFTSSKVRISKKGERYLVIPFRHGTPGSQKNPMPTQIYSTAVNLTHSRITGVRLEGSQQFPGQITYREAQVLKKNNPEKVRRNNYKWGGKLTVKESTEYNASKYQGMYRFQANPRLNRGLGKFINTTDNDRNYSTYITFRVMKESSAGWMHPGLKAMNILHDTIQKEKTIVLNLLADGVKKDFASLNFRH